MNYAALLGVITAVTFTLPLVARLAEMLGLPRSSGVVVSLGLALVAAGVWYVRSMRVRGGTAPRRSPDGGKLTGGSSYEPPKESDAGVQRHR